MSDIPFSTTDWSSVTLTEHRGISGLASWRTVQCGGIRVRMVEYTPGYAADHWCTQELLDNHISIIVEIWNECR